MNTSHIDYRAIGQRIKKFRLVKGFTQAQLGEEANVESSNISHIERGATKVSFPTLMKVANVLEVSLDELVYDSLKKNRHVSISEMNDLLANCTDGEIKKMVGLMKAVKSIYGKQ